MSLKVDHKGVLWVGTYAGGLDRFDPATGTFVHNRHDASDPGSISSDAVMSIYEDRAGVLWVGTFEGGLNRLDRETGRFIHYVNDPSNPTSLSNNRVTSFHEDSLGILWVGTDGGGLNRFDRATGTFTRFRHDPSDPESLSADDIWSIAEDRRGRLWIGTQGGGLNCWEKRDRRASRSVFERYREGDGLPNDHVYGILPDQAGHLWLSTNRGLSKFSPRSKTFRNYDVTHGLQSNEFNFGAYHRSPSGEMFFGGINGFNVFYPHRIRENPHVPRVVLTALWRLNEKVRLEELISETDGEIELDYRDDVVSFEFAALDYTAPEKNRYAYKLDGFDEDWIALGNMRRATYTNLDAGVYTLWVRGSNNDGLWSEPAVALNFRVVSPPWKTWWAKCIYLLLLGGVLLSYTRSQARKLRREAEHSKELERLVEDRTRELAERNRELQLANDRLEEASLTDSLTGLRNRRYLMTAINHDIALTARSYDEFERRGASEGPPPRPDFLFLMIDLDGLKGINDSYGHHTGDVALLQFRDLLQRVCRKSDTIIRWGGDEFLIVGRSTDRSAAESLADRIRTAVAEHPFKLPGGVTLFLSCSVGFARYPFLPFTPTQISWEQVLTIADRALYLAKKSGRNAWAAMFGTEKTPAVDLVQRINDDVERLVREGAIEFRSSISDPAQLVWDHA
jgi:diguanylate cyclase (GGDEF)-like protein